MAPTSCANRDVNSGVSRKAIIYEVLAGARTAQSIADAALAETKRVVFLRLGGKSTGSHGSGGGSSGGATDVVELTDANFEKLVLNSKDVWLVEFFAPWCGHCKNLAPHWKAAASELRGKVKVLNCPYGT
ncbi:unnamed protein product [Cylicostephanus goldi]|uniref:Thioredoxin domain-containing protein n=1 Tax=Cylicostephanus goldi TaxID=71465 RepID=A0A3P6R5T1_CYLGO|nr:unnamed protein product [Cylicostephanus goldi]